MPEKKSSVVKTTATVASTAVVFDPISELFSNSWEIVKKTWKKLLLISLVAGGFVLLYWVLLMIIGGASWAGLMATGGIETPLAGGMLGMAGLGIIVSLVFYIAVFSAVAAGFIKIVAEPNSTKDTMTVLKEGLGLAFPIFLTGLVTSLLAVGGLVFLIIPGLIISILLSMATYEVVLHKASVGQALSNSATIVSQNIGPIAVRWLVAIAVSLVIGFIMSILAMIPLVGLFTFVINMVLSWFFLAYWYLVYKQARANTDLKKPASLVWMYIVGFIGWVIIILGSVVIGGALSALMRTGGFTGTNPSSFDSEYSDSFGEYISEDELQYLNMLEGFDQSAPTGGEFVIENGSVMFDQIVNESDLTEEEKAEAMRAFEQMFGGSTETPTAE